MTDNRTTELLREGLTERGIEWRSGLEGVTWVGDWCFVEYDNGRLAATCEPVLTPEQAIAATLGAPINEATGKPFDFSKLADRLDGDKNATLGSGKPFSDAIANLRKTVRDAFSGESVSMLVEGNAIMQAIDKVEIATLGSEREKALEELVRDMWFWGYEGHMDNKSQDWQMKHIDGVLDRMKKLGIEVD